MLSVSVWLKLKHDSQCCFTQSLVSLVLVHYRYFFCFLQDGLGDFFADSNSKLYWVSFLDGMQRVLLLTDDIAVVVRGQGVRNFFNSVF